MRPSPPWYAFPEHPTIDPILDILPYRICGPYLGGIRLATMQVNGGVCLSRKGHFHFVPSSILLGTWLSCCGSMRRNGIESLPRRIQVRQGILTRHEWLRDKEQSEACLAGITKKQSRTLMFPASSNVWASGLVRKCAPSTRYQIFPAKCAFWVDIL